MAPYLGSQRNVHETLGMIGVIENSRFDLLPSTWRDRSDRSSDYHPGRTGVGADWVYYDPWGRTKVSRETTLSRAAVTGVQPNDVPNGWSHVDEDDDRTWMQRDTWYEYTGVVTVGTPVQKNPVLAGPSGWNGASGSDRVDDVGGGARASDG